MISAFFSLSLYIYIQVMRTGLEKGPVEGYEAEAKVRVYMYTI